MSFQQDLGRPLLPQQLPFGPLWNFSAQKNLLSVTYSCKEKEVMWKGEKEKNLWMG